MPVSESYLEYVIDQLVESGPVAAKKMFGGVGLYLNGLFFALIADDVLFFKVDESNINDYEKAGMPPFRPFGSYSMGYYRVPVGVMEDSKKLKVWAQKALSVAERKAVASKKAKKPAKKS